MNLLVLYCYQKKQEITWKPQTKVHLWLDKSGYDRYSYSRLVSDIRLTKTDTQLLNSGTNHRGRTLFHEWGTFKLASTE